MADNEDAVKKRAPCAKCGAPSTSKCSRCQKVEYCSRQCQKEHWKEAHKKICQQNAEKKLCQRCLKPADDATICEVPHPDHLLEDRGATIGGSKRTYNKHCLACQTDITIHESFGVKSYDPPGDKYCFKGAHTTDIVPSSDKRRVFHDLMTLQCTPSLQREINNIPTKMSHVRILTITDECNFNDSIRVRLNMRLPFLEELSLMDICFEEICLTPALTPKVRVLKMRNVPDNCSITVELPALEEFQCHHYGPGEPDEAWVRTMLDAAFRLRTFDSYKFRVGALSFASAALETVDLHRAELLEDLQLWAPRLKHLRLQACYGQPAVALLDAPPAGSAAAALGPGGGAPLGLQPSPFTVDVTHASMTPPVLEYLRDHPRVTLQGEDDEEDGGMFGGFGFGGPPVYGAGPTFGGGGPMFAGMGGAEMEQFAKMMMEGMGMMGGGGRPQPPGGMGFLDSAVAAQAMAQMMGMGSAGGNPDQTRHFLEMMRRSMMSSMGGGDDDDDEDDDDDDDDDEDDDDDDNEEDEMAEID